MAGTRSEAVGAAPPTLIDGLLMRAARTPDAPAFEILGDMGAPPIHLTYAGLVDRAARAAALVRRHGASPASRIALLHPPGESFLGAFFGCLWAGAVAIPVAQSLSPVGMERIARILADSQATLVLGHAAYLTRVSQRLNLGQDPGGPLFVPTDDDPGAPFAWPDSPSARPEDVAFIQYSSGSTAEPKGVLISHANILCNLGYLQDAFRPGRDDVGVCWLPHHHDMGLVAGILFPVHAGMPSVLMPPTLFMRDPIAWLQIISERRATISGGPNFAYEYCVNAATPERLRGLDLGRWTIAISGAEPVRADTIQRFAATFAECGFDVRAFYPSYGLAEATLMVSGGERLSGPRFLIRSVGAETRTLVSCGRPRAQVVIADPETLTPLAPGETGEILVAGPSLSAGYCNRPRTEAFVERADQPRTPYLRTGDLGFLNQGELFLHGRLKNLIIVRGRNIHAEDVEASARDVSDALTSGGSAAFSVDARDGEGLVVLQELGFRAADTENPQALATAISQEVIRRHEVQPQSCCILRAGALPRTSSGKVQRHRAKAAFEQGELQGILAHC